MKFCGEVPRTANFRLKIRGVETIGVAKMPKFRFKQIFVKKPRKARKFVETRLHYFCTILYVANGGWVRRSQGADSPPTQTQVGTTPHKPALPATQPGALAATQPQP